MSTPDNGYNPMRWDCNRRGCFNSLRRPKIEAFADCFPGRISFGDVDAIVEINGFALMLEWKSDTIDLPRGQQIMYRRITKGKRITVIVLCGCAETMRIDYMGWIFDGCSQEPERATLDDAKSAISAWVSWAESGGATQ